MNRDEALSIGVLGGTGPEGRGLALRWALTGHRVVIGSRDEERARGIADELSTMLGERDGSGTVSGADNLAASRSCDVVVLAVPYTAQADTIASVAGALAGKVLVTVVVPLRPPRVAEVRLPTAGSAAAEAQAQLGPSVGVAAAFQNVSAAKLADPDAEVGSDVLVCADDEAAKALALRLVADSGAQGYDAGPLMNAGVVEGLTSILIGLNQRHKARGAGIRITNVPRAGDAQG